MKFVDKKDKAIKVSCVILHFKGKELLQKCVESLIQSDLPLYETIVVANDPNDESLETIQKLYPNVIVLKNEKNFGVAKGRNVGLRYALRRSIDYLFATDNDLFLDKYCLRYLVEQMERHRDVGTIGAFIYNAEVPDRLLSAGGKVDFSQNVSGQFFKVRNHDDLMDVDFCGGGDILVRREIFDKIGLLDERYVGYGFEDVDFSFRVKKAGFRVCTYPKAKIWHMPHSNIGNYSFQKKYLESRNAVIFMKKYALSHQWLKYFFYIIFGFPYVFAIQGIIKKNFSGVYGKYRGLLDGFLSKEKLANEILKQYR